jgi:hypothetical protein
MPLRNATPLTFRPNTVTDTIDGTNALPGAMRSTADLIWAAHTRNVLVPRPAAIPFVDFGRPVTGELLQVIGEKIYGFVTSAQFPGHSEPFIWNTATSSFVPIAGMTEANTPVSAPMTGDWTPPTMAQIGAFVLFTHPGFSLPNAFGWLDMTGLHDTATGGVGLTPNAFVLGLGVLGTDAIGGLSAGNVGVGNLSKNVLQAGWRPGMVVTDSMGLIQPNTRINTISPDGLSFTLTKPSIGAVAQGDVLTVSGGTPTNPLWAAGNQSGFPLPAVPKAVTNFNGRAYFAVGPAVVASDSIDPLVRTNADQVLTFDNGLDVTAFGGIPLTTTVGFVSQNLLAFQGDAAIQGITGDPALGNWAKNLIATIGTLAPNAIFEMPSGTGYIAPDGLRIIDLSGQVGDPIGANGDGVALPFMNAIYPSRICASYNEDTIRISTTYIQTINGAIVGDTTSSEFWYHLKLKSWSGPHSFPAALISPFDESPPHHGYVMFPLDPSARGIWFSESRPSVSSTYIENGTPLSWTYSTSLMPDTGAMFMNAMNEALLSVALPTAQSITASFVNETGLTLDTTRIQGESASPFILGESIVGSGVISGSAAPSARLGTFVLGQSILGDPGPGAVFRQRLLPWDKEINFKQCRATISGPSFASVALGNLYLRYQITGWTVEYP